MTEQVSEVGDKRIFCLEMLESELVRVLYNRNDCERLSKAKHIIERYSGVDWIAYQQCPVMDGFQLLGYQRVGVKRHNDLFDLLVLSWAPGTLSPIHDHPCERCFLMCVSGDMYEDRYRRDNSGSITKLSRHDIPLGVATWIDDDIGLHAVGNKGSSLSCSIHCYIPGFTTPCKTFDIESGTVTCVTVTPKPPMVQCLSDFVFKKVLNSVTDNDVPNASPVTSSNKRGDIEDSFKKQRCPIEFAFGSEPFDDQAIRRAVDTVCDLSVHTGHLHYFNQLLAKPDSLASAVDALASTLNVNMYNFENAPVLTLMEKALLQHLASFLGWYDYSQIKERSSSHVSECHEESFDGIILPGASLCNLVALHIARARLFPEVLIHGAAVGSPPLVVFTSDESHCSIEKACIILGLGRQACVYVQCHPSTGSMDVQALEKAIDDQIQSGNRPFFINCTSGSTHSGAFDDCEALSKLAKMHNIWLHVDGALGASFLLPDEDPFKSLVKGISSADSI